MDFVLGKVLSSLVRKWSAQVTDAGTVMFLWGNLRCRLLTTPMAVGHSFCTI